MAELHMRALPNQEKKRDQGQKEVCEEDRQVEPVPERAVVPVGEQYRADGAGHDEHEGDFREIA